MVQLYYGDGMGKTTAAVGAAVRAAGAGESVLFVSFYKDGSSCEVAALERLGVQCLFPREQFQMFCPVTAEKQAALAAATTCSWVASGQPNLILFSIVSANRYTLWNTIEIFFIRLSSLKSRTSVPPMVIFPAFTSQKRAIRLHIVVFPAPEGPTMAVVVFSVMVKLT